MCRAVISGREVYLARRNWAVPVRVVAAAALPVAGVTAAAPRAVAIMFAQSFPSSHVRRNVSILGVKEAIILEVLLRFAEQYSLGRLAAPHFWSQLALRVVAQYPEQCRDQAKSGHPDIGDIAEDSVPRQSSRTYLWSKETALCNWTVGRKLGSVFSPHADVGRESEFPVLAPERRHLRLQRPRILTCWRTPECEVNPGAILHIHGCIRRDEVP